ncbi:MAG TPA: sigma-70 family RNA polymerase sigma factor, partial [Opitutaceae bacterium]|nr:sigma-70 family RNA polymerase sigma factor [Opitutaceae bacterium]
MPEDAELLRLYAAERSEAAFAELVRRHLNLVYSVALRQVAGDAHLAQDVSQQVFTALARKARAVAERPSVSGWLYRSTHFAASSVVRTERRRRVREQEMYVMNSPERKTGPHADWEGFRPELDAAIAELNEGDRDAVSLRFFEGRSFAEVGVALRLTENAARMRVDRALDKLNAALSRRGVTSTGAAITSMLANQAGVAAPAGLAHIVTSASSAGATMGGAAATLAHKTFIAAVVALAVVAIFLVQRGQEGGRPMISGSRPAAAVHVAAARGGSAVAAKAGAVVASVTPAESKPLGQKRASVPAFFPPIEDSLSALQILERMAQTYAQCASYFDTGVVRSASKDAGGRMAELTFSTAFVRPDRFRFEYTQTTGPNPQRYIVWAEGE